MNIRWIEHTDTDDCRNKVTGEYDELISYEAFIADVWMIVDEPHLGYGWRYAINVRDVNVRLDDSDGFATADDAKAAAITNLARFVH
jgi:hypothetical protein